MRTRFNTKILSKGLSGISRHYFNSWKFVPQLLCIIIVGVFLRIFRLRDLFYFAIDEEKGAYITRGISNLTHFPLAGHPTSIGFRLGPLFYYLTSPLYSIFYPFPLIVAYASIMCSVVSMVLIYRLGSKFGPVAGIISAYFYALSFINVLYERRGWQLSFESFFILIIIHSLIELRKGKQIYFIAIAICVSIVTQLEVGLFTLIPLILTTIFYFKIPIRWRYAILGVLLITLSNISLLFFDIRHQFLNTRYLINYFRHDSQIRIAENVPLSGERTVYQAHNLIPVTLVRTLIPFSEPNMAIQYANCPQYLRYKQNQVSLAVKILVSILVIYGFYDGMKRRKGETEADFLKFIIGLYLFIHITAISLYTYIFHGEMAEYYVLPLFVFFYLLCASLLFKICRRFTFRPIFVILLLFSVINVSSLLRSTNPYGLKAKTDAVKFALSIIGNRPFTLRSFQTCWYTGGFRYLFYYFGSDPVSSYMDEYLSEYYDPGSENTAEYSVTIMTPEIVGKNPQGYLTAREKTRKDSNYSGTFSAIEVYLKKLR